MKILDLTFSSPAEDLSCDEALLDDAEERGGEDVLRFWSPKKYFIVLGYSNAVREEVLDSAKVPFFRRCSGGGTILQGPGCLNYALILQIRPGGPLDGIRSTNETVMEKNRAALEKLLKNKVSVRGHTDLTLGAMKFSGNSQRRKRRALLFHGTFLLDFDLSRIDRTLKIPAKQPAYRQDRGHSSFVTNVNVSAASVKKALIEAWGAKGKLEEVPEQRIEVLSEKRYSRDEWNRKF